DLRLVRAAAGAVRDLRNGRRYGRFHGRQGLSLAGRGVVGQSGVRPSAAVLSGYSGRSRGAKVINFRYHVVSLTAVFLALAIGLVVGTAALNGPAADALGEQVDALRKANT